MEEIIFEKTASSNFNLVRASLTALDGPNGAFGTLNYKVTYKNETREVIFSFNNALNQINFGVPLDLSDGLRCLIACGLSLSGPIADCYKKNKGNWRGFIQCLKDQEHTLGTSTTACLLGCITDI